MGKQEVQSGEIQSGSRSWQLLVMYGIISVIFGIFALTAPLGVAITMVWIIGILELVEGIISLVAAFSKNLPAPKGLLVFYALCSVFFGIVTVINPAAMANILLIFFAVWLIIAGIYRIAFAALAKNPVRKKWLLILSGLLVIVLGIMMIAQPQTGIVITTIWIGAFVLAYGIFQIVAGIQLRRS